jgi:hypothetical protein
MDAAAAVPFAMAFAAGLAALDFAAWAITALWDFFRGVAR